MHTNLLAGSNSRELAIQDIFSNVKFYENVGILSRNEASVDSDPDYKIFLSQVLTYMHMHCQQHGIQIVGQIEVIKNGEIQASAKRTNPETGEEEMGLIIITNESLRKVSENYNQIADTDFDGLKFELQALENENEKFLQDNGDKNEEDLTPDELQFFNDMFVEDSPKNIRMDDLSKQIEQYRHTTKMFIGGEFAIGNCTDSSRASRNELIFILDQSGNGQFVGRFNTLFVVDLYLRSHPIDIEGLTLQEVITQYAEVAFTDFMGLEGITKTEEEGDLGDAQIIKDRIMERIKKFDAIYKVEEKKFMSEESDVLKLTPLEKLIMKSHKVGNVDDAYFSVPSTNIRERISLNEALGHMESLLNAMDQRGGK